MFNKPTFGSNTSTFGSFNAGTTAASPFSGFKPTTGTSAFGAPPAFGTAAAQPTTGGLFGTPNTSTGLFGSSTSTAAPAFGGTSTGGFGFGATNTGGGLFGSNTTSSGLFANTQQNNSSFGAKPAAFGFGATSTAGSTGGGLFGTTATPSTGLFGQQNNTLGGGLFSSNTSSFGAAGATVPGTAHAKYNPLVGTDVVVKSGASQTINIKHHCITCMKEYEGKSLEELRLEDYTAGRKGSASAGVFGFQQQPEAKPLFGGSTFGQPATTTASSVFGGGGLNTSGGFGQTNTFSFGNNAPNATNTGGGLFGAAKPTFGAASTTGTGLFGATTTQAPTFGTNTQSFGFGSNTQNQAGGLFGAKPAGTGFGTAGATTGTTAGGTSGFGAFGQGSLFGAKPQQSAAAPFATTTPAFGSLSGGFGTNTSTSGGGLFGNNAFGKPAAAQPTFGFNAPTTGLGTGLGGGLGANSFQAKPAAPAFGSLGGGLFSSPANTFGTDSGLGGGLFGNSSLGGSGLGLGMQNNSLPANNSLSGSSAAGNVHEQILTLVARPYGDSPLFKDLPVDSQASLEVLKPTNPAAVKAVLDSANNYRVTNSTSRLKLHPNSLADKKSLFDGLEESDASLEDKLCLKQSRKRLVLRPRATDSVDGPTGNTNRNRSVEEENQNNNVNGRDTEQTNNKSSGEDDRRRRDTSTRDNQNIEAGTDRHGAWLSATKHQWSAEKDKQKDAEPTPRLYPNLENEVPIHISERRSSWLTTKPLRKPLSSNPESAENSVRELGLRPTDSSQDKENVDSLSGSVSCCHALERPTPTCAHCANQCCVLVSEPEHVAPRDMPPHPTGVKLTLPGYYTIPSLDEMIKYMRPDGSCVVPHLTIGRKNYGNVFYDAEIDVAGLDLDSLVHFLNKEVTIYPDDSNKPPLGEGLNRRAIVTLDRIWPRDKTEKRPITDPERLLAMDYEGKLRRVCDKHDTKFIEYRPQTGSWVFRVEHFSKYSLTDSDEEDEITPEVLKRQLANNQVQKAAPVAPPKPPAAPGLGGLGSFYPGLSQPGLASQTTGLGQSSLATGLNQSGLASGLPMSQLAYGGLGGSALIGHDDLYAMQQTSLNLLSGAGKAFEMDTTEDNTESPSMYQDSHRAYGVKSPTSELARLEHRQSHNVQLMKASLYADTEMEDDVSVSTGDQLVPRDAPPSIADGSPRPPHPAQTHPALSLVDDQPLPVTEEIQMKPLIVRPHTVVLKYHRKVPPFHKTIAGRLDAACIADMAVCRARHTRAGFGPRSTVSFVTSYDSITPLPNSGDLYDLGKYVRGRAQDDWSETVVARLALQNPDNNAFVETMTRHLDTLLEYSDLSAANPDQCARLSIQSEPARRRAALAQLIQLAGPDTHTAQFGIASAYSCEVFKLCEALWGADLENDGVAGMDEASIVNRYRKLQQWFTEAVAQITDEELKKPTSPELEDETDTHSVRVWTLLLGGRVLQACKLAAENGDCNMAALIAQCSGGPSFRSLVRRQVQQWRESGAASAIGGHRLASLQLAAGEPPREHLASLDWLRALHVTYRYLCPQVPSVEQVIRKYESLFRRDATDSEEDIDMDLSTVKDEVDMQLPLPPYTQHYEVSLNNCQQRRVLDLRYELIRARATNTRPKLQPAGYTPDPMDYSLCFALGVWLGSASAASVAGVAEQLEAAGAWHRAVQALHYHPDDNSRNHLVRAVLSRHAPAKADTPELKERLQLVRRLQVPEKWLLLAQAHRAKYERQPKLEVEHLVGAEQWNAAHKVLLEELLPNAVLADNLQSVAPLIEKLNSAAERHEVSGWDSGGQALHHYIHVCDEIRGLVSSAEDGQTAETQRSAVSRRLEALRPRVAAACRALARLTAHTHAHAAARTEMGARLVQLAVAAGEPPHHLAALLRALRLPPDCTAAAQHKITTDLTEAASEMCIESTNSSPISSHHRAAVQS